MGSTSRKMAADSLEGSANNLVWTDEDGDHVLRHHGKVVFTIPAAKATAICTDPDGSDVGIYVDNGELFECIRKCRWADEADEQKDKSDRC